MRKLFNDNPSNSGSLSCLCDLTIFIYKSHYQKVTSTALILLKATPHVILLTLRKNSNCKIYVYNYIGVTKKTSEGKVLFLMFLST